VYPHESRYASENTHCGGSKITCLSIITLTIFYSYGLSYEEVEKGLPQIDTSRTLIREVCPAFLSNVECRPGKYRRYDGLCNNVKHPTWGATNTPFSRLVGPLFSDGISAPKVSSLNNRDLPIARVVSRTMHPDEGYHEHAATVMLVAFGQFMDHDFTLMGTPAGKSWLRIFLRGTFDYIES